MGVPPMKHEQDAQYHTCRQGFCKPLLGEGDGGVNAAHRTMAAWTPPTELWRFLSRCVVAIRRGWRLKPSRVTFKLRAYGNEQT